MRTRVVFSARRIARAPERASIVVPRFITPFLRVARPGRFQLDTPLRTGRGCRACSVPVHWGRKLLKNLPSSSTRHPALVQRGNDCLTWCSPCLIKDVEHRPSSSIADLLERLRRAPQHSGPHPPLHGRDLYERLGRSAKFLSNGFRRPDDRAGPSLAGASLRSEARVLLGGCLQYSASRPGIRTVCHAHRRTRSRTPAPYFVITAAARAKEMWTWCTRSRGRKDVGVETAGKRRRRRRRRRCFSMMNAGTRASSISTSATTNVSSSWSVSRRWKAAREEVLNRTLHSAACETGDDPEIWRRGPATARDTHHPGSGGANRSQAGDRTATRQASAPRRPLRSGRS